MDSSEELLPDGSISLYFLDGTMAVYKFEDIQYHGLRQAHVNREGFVRGDGPLEYFIKHNDGDITAYPWTTIIKTYLIPNSDEYADQARARREELDKP